MGSASFVCFFIINSVVTSQMINGRRDTVVIWRFESLVAQASLFRSFRGVSSIIIIFICIWIAYCCLGVVYVEESCLYFRFN